MTELGHKSAKLTKDREARTHHIRPEIKEKKKKTKIKTTVSQIQKHFPISLFIFAEKSFITSSFWSPTTPSTHSCRLLNINHNVQ